MITLYFQLHSNITKLNTSNWSVYGILPNKQIKSQPFLLHLPVGAGALLPHQLINTTRVCQEEEWKSAAVGRNSD